MDKIKRHKEICDRVHEIYKKKNEAYGDSFSKTFNEFGLISAVVRIYDKVNRIIALTRGNKNDIIDESLKDSLLDLSGYAILTILELEIEENAQKENKN